jgi:O-antigen/teichoic acid export membrane protein
VLQKIRQLFSHLIIYGVGDVATSVISFLLLPLYVRYLSPDDYGVLSLLIAAEVVTKIVFRWGIDAAFMRLYYDCASDDARRRLASTQVLFLVVVNGVLLAAGLLAAPALAHHLFGTEQYAAALRLVLLNTFVVGFYYVPFHVMRIEGQPRLFIALTFARSLITLVLRLVFVVGLHGGVMGVVMADVVVTAVFTLVLARWFVPLLRPTFSADVLRESLRFGLPRVPHGVAHQVIAVFDRYILARFVTLHELGLYSIGASFGLAMKLFLSAFEYAWAPFYFGLMREPDAKQVFSRVTTYGVAILALLTAGLAAVSGDLVGLMTTQQFRKAAAVVPWVAAGVGLQGVYLLTSIGLNITKHTEYYPVATGLAAGTSVLMNLLLVPRYGIVGAAVANTIAYATLATVAFRFSQRFYPIQYEGRRVALAVLAGAAAYLLASLLPGQTPSVAGLLARGLVVVSVFTAILFAAGFFVRGELVMLAAIGSKVRGRRTAEAQVDTSDMAGEVTSTPLTDAAVDAGDDPGVAPEQPGAATLPSGAAGRQVS